MANMMTMKLFDVSKTGKLLFLIGSSLSEVVFTRIFKSVFPLLFSTVANIKLVSFFFSLSSVGDELIIATSLERSRSFDDFQSPYSVGK